MTADQSIEARVAVGSMWSLAAIGATMVASLIATPFVLRGLGPEAYGVYSIIQVIIGYLSVADIGMGDASTRFAAASFARGERREEASVIWTSLVIEAIVTLPLAVGVIALARPLVVHALKLPVELQDPAAIAVAVAVIGFVAKNAATIFNTPQVVRLRFRTVAAINATCGVLQIAFVPVVIAFGGGLVGAVVVAVAANVLNLCLHFVQARALIPEMVHPTPRRSLVAPLVRFGTAVALSAMVVTALTQTEKLFLVRFDSAQAVAYYSVALTLATMVAVVPRAVKGALFPAFSQIDGRVLDQLYAQAVRLLLLIIAPIAVAMCLLAEPFLTYWAGPEYGHHSVMPFYILLAGSAVGAIAHVPIVLLKGMGRSDVIARFQLLEVAPYLVAAILLTWHLGALGAALAWSLRTVADTVLVFGAASRFASVGVAPTPRQRWGMMCAASALAAPLVVIFAWNNSVALRLFLTPVALLAYGAVVWTMVLEHAERRRFVALRDHAPALALYR